MSLELTTSRLRSMSHLPIFQGFIEVVPHFVPHPTYQPHRESGLTLIGIGRSRTNRTFTRSFGDYCSTIKLYSLNGGKDSSHVRFQPLFSNFRPFSQHGTLDRSLFVGFNRNDVSLLHLVERGCCGYTIAEVYCAFGSLSAYVCA